MVVETKKGIGKQLDHWCRGCGTYMTNPDGLCAKCRKPLTEQYKALQHTPTRVGLIAHYLSEGYQQRLDSRDYIDLDVAREQPCKLCGHICAAVILRKGSSKVAISRCTFCANEYEF